MKFFLTTRRKDTSDIAEPRVSISQNSIKINHQGKPINGTSITGHAYLLIDCSGSMQANNKLKQAEKGALNFAEYALAKNYLTELIQFDSSAKFMCEPCGDLSASENIRVRLNSAEARIRVELRTLLLIRDHVWHDLDFEDLKGWGNKRGLSPGEELAGKTFRYRCISVNKYQFRLRYSYQKAIYNPLDSPV